MILVEKGQNFVFSVNLFDGREDKFIKLDLYRVSDNQNIGTYSVNHLENGIYLKKDIPANATGVFLARYEVFKDVALTKKDRKYSIKTDYIRVEDFIEAIENAVDFGDGSAT